MFFVPARYAKTFRSMRFLFVVSSNGMENRRFGDVSLGVAALSWVSIDQGQAKLLGCGVIDRSGLEGRAPLSAGSFGKGRNKLC
jgi:hypothetical protein